jgi:hypothetical protein
MSGPHMSNVIEFSGTNPPNPKIDHHAAAFRDLEAEICDCVRMNQIAVRLMPAETDEHLMFAVLQSLEMLERFQKRYYARWEGKIEDDQ